MELTFQASKCQIKFLGIIKKPSFTRQYNKKSLFREVSVKVRLFVWPSSKPRWIKIDQTESDKQGWTISVQLTCFDWDNDHVDTYEFLSDS